MRAALKVECPETGKRCFGSRETAEREVERLLFSSLRPKVPRRAYRCEHCGWWHLTAKSRWRKRGADAE